LSSQTKPDWFSKDEIDAVASLAGVDGAIVMTRELAILGFGAKINVPAENVANIKWHQFLPIPGRQEVLESTLEDLGGTRHQSSAKFVGVNRDSVAFVISQDRHMKLMHWDSGLEAVVVTRNAQWWL
jgi:hypothetical protein